MYYVYFIKSIKYDEIYVGSTDDLRRRLSEHNAGVEASTKRYKPWRLVYYEAYQSEKDAREREMKLKHHGNTIRELKKRIQDSFKNGAGFTLIELLTTMTIIAVLAGLALVSFQGARKTARDGKRKADLEQIRSALEMCYSDDNEYPGSISDSVTCAIGGNTYLSPTPTDPVTKDDYDYSPGGTTYTLCANLETATDEPYCLTNP